MSAHICGSFIRDRNFNDIVDSEGDEYCNVDACEESLVTVRKAISDDFQ